MDKKKVIEAKVDEVMSGKPSEPAQKNTTQKQARPSDEQPEGMPDLSAMFGGAGGAEGMPDLSAMFGAGGAGGPGAGGMPDLSKLPGLSWKQRMTFKLMKWGSSPKLRFLKSKWCMPLWGLIAVILLALGLVAIVVLLAWKLLRYIFLTYFGFLFKKKSGSELR